MLLKDLICSFFAVGSTVVSFATGIEMDATLLNAELCKIKKTERSNVNNMGFICFRFSQSKGIAMSLLLTKVMFFLHLHKITFRLFFRPDADSPVNRKTDAAGKDEHQYPDDALFTFYPWIIDGTNDEVDH